MEQALDRMRGLIGYAGEWADLMTWLPEGWTLIRSAAARRLPRPLPPRSNWSNAGLTEIRQADVFAPIQLRGKPNAGE